MMLRLIALAAALATPASAMAKDIAVTCHWTKTVDMGDFSKGTTDLTESIVLKVDGASISAQSRDCAVFLKGEAADTAFRFECAASSGPKGKIAFRYSVERSD